MTIFNAPGIPSSTETPSGVDVHIFHERERIMRIAIAEMHRHCEHLFVARESTHVDEDAIDGLHAVDLTFDIEGGPFAQSVDLEIGYVMVGGGRFDRHNVEEQVIRDMIGEKARSSIGA